MDLRTAQVGIIKRSSDQVVLCEGPRPIAALVYLAASLGLVAVPFLVPSEVQSSARRLWLIATALLPLGVNRLLGTVSTFDSRKGVVSIARTFGQITVFHRRFRMCDVIRVFHDERAYSRPSIQNPKLELPTGRQVNISQWCPAETNLEAEVATVNRFIHRWKQAHCLAAGQVPMTLAQAVGEATPKRWTIEGLDALTEYSRSRNLRWAKLSISGLAITGAVAVICGRYFPSRPSRALCGVALAVAILAALLSSSAVLIDFVVSRRGAGQTTRE